MNFVLSGELYTKLLTYLFTQEGTEELVDGLKSLPRANVVNSEEQQTQEPVVSAEEVKDEVPVEQPVS